MQYKYTHYLPHYKPGLQPPLQQFQHDDVGLRADPAKPSLLGAPGSSFTDITPAIGTEVHGLQLSSLTPQQKDELALLAAERGIVVFRGQDFADIGPDKQVEFAAHFGPLHVHQNGGHVKDHPELLSIYRDLTYAHMPLGEWIWLTSDRAGAVDNQIKNNVSSIKWHSDMTYEMYVSYRQSW